jgi:hypothetical protein
MYIVQNVLNYLKNINHDTRAYLLGLLLSYGRKNCRSMADMTGISVKSLYSFLRNAKENIEEIEKKLIEFANKTHVKDVLRTLVIDPTTLIKSYAIKMEKLSHDRAGSTGHVEKCLVPVYATLVDKNVKIPINLNFWVQEKITGARRYKSKAMLAQELIVYAVQQGIEFDFVSLDGAFAIPVMFAFFKAQVDMCFIMRIPRNRRIKLADGTLVQLQHCPSLKLKRNEREKMIQAELYGEKYFFTAHKRKKRDHTWETVYLVSNMDVSAKEQVAAYNLRWPMEKVIRTTKQKFGAAQSQVIEIEKQQAHLMACFLIHTICESIKNGTQKQSVDEIVNFIRKYHSAELIDAIKKPDAVLRPLNIDLDAKLIQNSGQILSKNIEFIGISKR